MPRKVKDMLKIIKKDGWVLSHQVGSHRQFTHPTKTGKVTISGHRDSDDVPIQIEKSILKQAGLL